MMIRRRREGGDNLDGRSKEVARVQVKGVKEKKGKEKRKNIEQKQRRTREKAKN